MKFNNATFSVNTYDHDGDISTKGIFLHFGAVAVQVADDIKDFRKFIDRLKSMEEEIAENYFPEAQI